MITLYNLAAYSAQVLLLIAAGGSLMALLKIENPRVRLTSYQGLLAICVLLPFLEPWRQAAARASILISQGPAFAAGSGAAHGIALPSWQQSILYIASAGIALRLFWILAGFWRLAAYRRRARPEPLAHLALQERLAVQPEIYISDDVSGPVTFGWLRPTILVPPNWRDNEAVACHELLHVRRRDWLFTVTEQLMLCALWFHPGVWWLVGQIQLAREETVDRETVRILESREEYLDTLLRIAAVRAGMDLQPGTLFLKRRHLRKRVASLMREVSMTKFRMSLSSAALAATVIAVGWMATRALPLMAAPQDFAAMDAPGVQVDTGGLKLLHRTGVDYPREANGVTGIVTADLTLNDKGEVTDARVTSGPEELRSAVLASVLHWHFATDSAAPATAQVTVRFTGTPPPASQPAMPNMVVKTLPGGKSATLTRIDLSDVPDTLRDQIAKALPIHIGDEVTRADLDNAMAAIRGVDEHLRVTFFPAGEGKLALRIGAGPLAASTQPGMNQSGTLTKIDVSSLPQALQDRVMQAIPIHEGQNVTMSDFDSTMAALRGIDEHLRFLFSPAGEGKLAAKIFIPGEAAGEAPKRIRVGGNVQRTNLIEQQMPVYPAQAKAARIQGQVRFMVTIGKDGHVENIELVSGPPELVQAAQSAVKNWVYRPTLLNGNPVEVVTTVDVNFTLSQ
ncbi:MAG: M56 family metallopeptidase [Bryobacteraceae bacterium]